MQFLVIFGLSFDNKSPRLMPPSEKEQCRQVCGFTFLGNIYGVNGVGMVDAAVLPFGFLVTRIFGPGVFTS